MNFVADFLSRVVLGSLKTLWQSFTDRELGRTQQANENLAKSNKELKRHAKIDSNHVDVDDAYAGLGLSDGDED